MGSWEVEKLGTSAFYLSFGKQNLWDFISIEFSIPRIFSYSWSSFSKVCWFMYLHAIQKSNQVCVSEASCWASVNLLINTAGYRRFLQASARFEHTDLEALRIWSVRENFSSAGKFLVIWKISIAAAKANLWTSRSLALFILSAKLSVSSQYFPNSGLPSYRTFTTS